MPNAQTLLDLLEGQGGGEPQTIRFFNSPGDYEALTVPDLKRAALRWLGVLQSAGIAAGTEVVMPLDKAQDFLGVFWASLLGGAVVMPLAAPTNDATCAKILDVLGRRADARLVLDDAGFDRLAKGLEDADRDQLAARRVWADGPARDAAQDGTPVERTPDDIAFVQYSSGSTRAPKGVVIRHGQALANLEAIRLGASLGPADLTFSWMPLSHDMGLVGFHLSPLYAGASQIIMPTPAFARTPLVWLQDAGALGATILSSPNFGYRHTLKAAARKGLPEGLDLSRVRLVLNGAEPISVDVALQFLDELDGAGLARTTMLPVYGLAEATLAVTFPALGKEIGGLNVARDACGVGDAIRRVPSNEASLAACGCGVPLPGMSVRIAGDDGGSLPAEHVGRVWIKGDSVTQGYYDDAEATAAALMGEGWLDTGDLGFMADGELYITGRLKDLVIVAGQNFYPHDLEESLLAALGLDALRVAVAPVRRADAPEEAAVFIMHRGDPESFRETAAATKKHLAETFGIGVEVVVPVTQIPRTTSGKVQRLRLSQDLVSGTYDDVLRVLTPEWLKPAAADAAGSTAGPAAGSSSDSSEDTTPEGLEKMMSSACADVLGELRFTPTDNLFEQGMSSIDLAEIHGLIEARYPKGLDIRDFFDQPTIRGLAALLSERIQAGAISAT